MNKHGRIVVGEVVEFEGDMLTVNVDGGIRYLILDQMPQLVEMLCPPHLEKSIVGQTIQYRLDYRGKLKKISLWPLHEKF